MLLSAPVEVLLDRVTHRDTARVEPMLRASATVELNTRISLAELVDRLMALAGPAPTRR